MVSCAPLDPDGDQRGTVFHDGDSNAYRPASHDVFLPYQCQMRHLFERAAPGRVIRRIPAKKGRAVKKYIVLYRAPTSAEEQMKSATPEQAKAGMDAWMKWSKKAASAIVDLGAPTGHAIAVGKEAPAPNAVVGYSILQADSRDAACALLEGHPHLTMPGFSIDVHEMLPLPGM